MPDKPSTGPDTTATQPNPAAAGDTGTSGQPPAPADGDLRAMLAKERGQREKREQELNQLRTAYNQRDREISQLRRMAGTGQSAQNMGDALFGGGAPATPPQPDIEQYTRELEQVKYNQGFLQFRLDHPGATEHWDDINTILNNQATLAEVASYLPGSQTPDIYRTLKNALREVEHRKYREASDANDRKREEVEKTRRDARGAATISGTAASGEEPPIDLGPLSADEMLDKGMIEYDKNNPPRHIREKQ